MADTLLDCGGLLTPLTAITGLSLDYLTGAMTIRARIHDTWHTIARLPDATEAQARALQLDLAHSIWPAAQLLTVRADGTIDTPPPPPASAEHYG